ncbi:MAG: nif-specific transcriptional activator NifA, partial [Campylobacterales bacterium]|nr:nif-specific transcriptional activator NifA [Campylobacterales bacterium]
NHVLPFNYQKYIHTQEPPVVPPAQSPQIATAAPQREERSSATPLTKNDMQEMEREAILQALIEHKGIQTKAARALGMSARQIGYKMKKFGIDL